MQDLRLASATDALVDVLELTSRVRNMTNYAAKEALDNAKVNANNTIMFAKRMEPENLNHAKALESIGYSLHALARAMEAMNK